MELIFKKGNQEIWFHILEKPYSFFEPFDKTEFSCVVFNNNENISHEELCNFSETFVETQCRAVHSIGYKCELIHDYIDESYVIYLIDNNIETDDTLMTTWDLSDDFQDMVFYVLNCTQFKPGYSDKLLLIFLDQDEVLCQQVIQEIKEQWIEGKELE